MAGVFVPGHEIPYSKLIATADCATGYRVARLVGIAEKLRPMTGQIASPRKTGGVPATELSR
jgi:hypothetical protein